MARVGTLSYNYRLSLIFTAHHNFKKKFAHLYVECVKVVYLIYQLTTNTFFMQNFTLRFGKYKGQQFLSTPTSYQQWLLKQDWFKMPTELTEVQKASKQISQLSGQLKGWNGYSSKGAAIYDSLFDAEVALDQAVENEMKYFGMNEETKRAEMDWEYAEISACNMVDDYYNN